MSCAIGTGRPVTLNIKDKLWLLVLTMQELINAMKEKEKELYLAGRDIELAELRKKRMKYEGKQNESLICESCE